MSFVAECDSCGVLERGELEDVGDVVDEHDRFHDVRVRRVATDGGTELSQSEFRAVLYAPSTTPTDERPRCPECGEVSARQNTGKPNGGSRANREWWCNECGARFDEPVYGDQR